jgi:molybdopterin-containing oxidoreductase family membrane subunit
MGRGGPGFAILVLGLAGASACWLWYSLRVVTEGHLLFGTSSYGATWGIIVANLVHVIGISHVGIAVSATVRVLNLRQYRNISRVAEVMTLVALVTAVLNIALDVGRPDRFITKTLVYGRWYAPMVWSLTVIVLYFLASAAYLYLSMRRDLWMMSSLDKRRAWFYKALAFGYTDAPAERHRHARALFWLAICLVPVMISVHSVYGLVFGLLPPRAGWYNPLQAPYFVLGAIVSGFSAVLVIAALLRWAYSWSELLTDRLFRAFGSFLAFSVFLYLYFTFSEHLTAQFAYLPAERAVSSALLSGELSTLFWSTVVAGLLVPFAYLFLQAINQSFFSVGLTSFAALLINLALWIKRFLLVVPAQYEPHIPLPRAAVPYEPTWPEIVVTAGSYAVAGLLFLAIIRLIPVIELPSAGDARREEAAPFRSPRRSAVVLLTLLAAGLLIAWGVWTRDEAFAPVKWVLGSTLLVAVPLEWCLIRDRDAKRPDLVPG